MSKSRRHSAHIGRYTQFIKKETTFANTPLYTFLYLLQMIYQFNHLSHIWLNCFFHDFANVYALKTRPKIGILDRSLIGSSH